MPRYAPHHQNGKRSRAKRGLRQHGAAGNKRGPAILRDRNNQSEDPAALALSALGWVLADENHADRLLALTGVSPEELRERIGENEVLAAILDFVLQHEPDTLACAAALGVTPQALVAAHAKLAAPAGDADWGA